MKSHQHKEASDRFPDNLGDTPAGIEAGIVAAAAAIPTTSPARTSTRVRQFATVPTALVGTLTSRLVPLATRSLAENSEIISGITMMLPLIPNRPEAMPITRPSPR